MEKRDDFEHRLGQGLKRWAEAGQPTLDLEAYVLGQGAAPEPGVTAAGTATGADRPEVGAATLDQGEAGPGISTPAAAAAPVARSRRPWLRWAVSAAAAVILLTGATFTFPAWAGTAAAWPLIGPVIQEMIMEDAGLKWAYDAGLIQGTVAEASSGDVTVRVLAVVPDQAITTILYQITGLPEAPVPDHAKPAQVGRGGLLGGFLARPASTEPRIEVRSVPGSLAIFGSQSPPMQTPVGLVGTITTNAIGADGGNMELEAEVNGEKLVLSFPVSRSASDRLTREYPVGQSRTIDEITYNIDAVLQTPVHTVVRYQVTKPGFKGGYSWSNHEYSLRLEAGADPIYSNGDYGQGDFRYALFPKTKLPARLVLPASVKGVASDIVWTLEQGAVQSIQGVPVKLVEWESEGDKLAVRFEYPFDPGLVSFDDFEAVGADGAVIPLKEEGSGWSDRGGPEHSEYREVSHAFSFVQGAKPVALRAKQVAVPVQGPWIFQLPAE